MQKHPNYSFSIVIPCLNEKDYISNCLDSIIAQDYDKELIEIIIVDGESNDGTLDIVNKYKENYKNILVFKNPLKKTPRSLNIGIKHSKGEIIVILGAHAKIDKDFIKYNNYYLHEKNVKCTGNSI